MINYYADDLLLYVSNPIQNFPVILSMLQKFGSFSGYKINLHKSECFPINALAKGLLQSDVPFKLSRSGFRYLGINITHSMSSLVSGNFTPLLEQAKSDFQRWSNLPLSLIGRINAVKMNVLPKFLFVFQCIPLFLPKKFFKPIDQIVTDFLCGGKVPRIRKLLLQRCHLNGGLSLPNFMFYYWSVNIHKITFWLSSSTTTWCRLEVNSCISTSPLALLTSPLSCNVSSASLTHNPIDVSTLRIWCQFRRHFKFNSASTLMPLLENHIFPASLSDPVFKQWHAKGLRCFRDLYRDGTFCSYVQLSSDLELLESHLYRFLQIRHCSAT